MARPAPLGLQTIALPRFRGANLRDQPDGLAAGEALDLLNVELSEIGGVRRRPGTQVFDSAARAAALGFVAPMTAGLGVRRLLESWAGGVAAVDINGVLQHSNATGNLATGVARFGGPNSPRNYIADGVHPVFRYDSAGGFTFPTCTVKNLVLASQVTAQTMPKGSLTCTWPGEERLLVGGFGATGLEGPGGEPSGPEYVWVSEPGDPEAYAKTSFMRLVPGDGERMLAIVAWREMVFIFKETRFFVLRSISVDSRGVTTFQRQAVDVGAGAVGPKAVAVGNDGVYFVSRRGLMRTRGGDPALVAPQLAPLFSGVTPFYYRGGAPAVLDTSTLTVVGTRLLWSYQSGLPGASAPDRTWVIEMDGNEEAVLWDLAIASGCALRVGERDDLIFAKPGATTARRHHRAVVGDDTAYAGGAGSGFSSWWTGAYTAIAGERVARIRQIALWGAGEVDVGLAADFAEGGLLQTIGLGGTGDTWGDGTGADTWGGGTNPADTWGAGESISPALARRGWKGARFALRLSSMQVSATARGPWSVSRAVLHVPNGGVRPASDLTGKS